MKLTVLLTIYTFGNFVRVVHNEHLHFLSDEFIGAINRAKLTWKAGRNFPHDMPLQRLSCLLGVHQDNHLHLPSVKMMDDDDDVDIPITFDARLEWPQCEEIIGTIGDQANCGSCWAYAASKAMSDRICIHSDGATRVHISAEDLLTCCPDCGMGCAGGLLGPAWSHWARRGLVTGGGYGSTAGCKAYQVRPCPACNFTAETPGCYRHCDDGRAEAPHRYFGQNIYALSNSERHIQREILRNGPVEAAFMVYEDFFSYRNGVYVHAFGDDMSGHAVKILGWGVLQGVKYWLASNTWTTAFGEEGYFKILRGVNHCGIEEQIVAGLPRAAAAAAAPGGAPLLLPLLAAAVLYGSA